MANGANRLFEVIKQTSEDTNLSPSQIISLTVKSVNPLIFSRDDRLEITKEFCVFNKSVKESDLQVGDIITAMVFNDGQKYFIQQNDSETGTSSYNDLSNKPKINNVELSGNKTAADLLLVSTSELETILESYLQKAGGTLTGNINLQNNSLKFSTSGNVEWKEDGYGDKFRIIPDFGGVGSNNKLLIQSTVGDAGTDPTNWKTIAYIKADTGEIQLIGEMNFGNKTEYGAIKKTRTLSNTDYSAYLGVGGNISSRLELLDSSNNVLCSVEVRPDGHIWNGKNNMKLVERARQTWGSSLSFTMQSGDQAIAILNNTDMMVLWVGGVSGSESLSTVRIYGTEAQATFDRTTMTVTLKYNDNRSFTGNVIIS